MGIRAAAAEVLNQADIISLTALACVIFWGFLFFTQVSSAALAPDPVSMLGSVWEQHKELVFLVFAAYGITRKGE